MARLRKSQKTERKPAKNTAVLLLSVIIALMISYIVYYSILYPPMIQTEEMFDDELFLLKAGFDYEVQASQKTLLWPAETIFPADRPVYFYATDPVLKVFTFADFVPLKEDDYKTEIAVRAFISTLNRSNKELWAENISLDLPSEIITGDFVYEQSFSLNIVSLRQRLIEIKENLSLRQEGTDIIRIVLAVSVAGEGGEHLLREYEATLLCTLDREGFHLTPAAKRSFQDKAVIKEIQLGERRATIREALANQSSLIFITILFVVAWWCLMFSEKCTKQYSPYNRFKEWITEGYVPLEGRTVVSVSSLEGLVDVAIDMNKRVIRNQRAVAAEETGGNPSLIEEYYVLDGNTVYRHRIVNRLVIRK